MSVPTKAVTSPTKRVKTPPKLIEAANSAINILLKEQTAQISTARFDPVLFDANIQTDPSLIENYLKKQTKETEIATDPIKFEQPKCYENTMIQTEPPIETIWKPVEEPLGYKLP
jgi:hypothetical protein